MSPAALHNDIDIAFLADRPELVPQVAAWGFAEWGHLNTGQTLASRQADLLRELHRDAVPTTFAALERRKIVGTAALVFDDLKGDPRNPWLASVYVRPEARGRGIASLLVRRVEAQAARLGYGTTYLFTSSAASLYCRLGWRVLEKRAYRGEEIQVMQRELAL